MKYILPCIIFIVLISLSVLSASISPVSAQTSCDLCGACGGDMPPDYNQCVECLYENPGSPPSGVKSGYAWTVIGCLPTSPGGFVQAGIRVFTVTIGGIMFIVLLYGSFLLLTSTGDPEKISQGKSLVVSAIIAIFIVLFAVFILQFIGSSVLKIPGFGEG